MQRRAFFLIAAGVVSSACLRSLRTPTAWQTGRPTPPQSPLAANPAKGVWPDALKPLPAKTVDALKWATVNRAPLQYIPCYCGCAGQGHQNNYDCYVSEERAGGWLILSDHSFG